jgi:hypothetical protein
MEYWSREILCYLEVSQTQEANTQTPKKPRLKMVVVTHEILALGRNGVDELIGAQEEITTLGILDSMLDEARLGVGRELLRLVRPNEGLLDGLSGHGELGHGCI